MIKIDKKLKKSIIFIYGTKDKGLRLNELLRKLDVNIKGFIISDNQEESDFIQGACVYKLSNWIESIKRNDFVPNTGEKVLVLIAVSEKNKGTVLGYLKDNDFKNYVYISENILQELAREISPVRPERWLVSATPVSRKFGFDRGKPIDRYYIEKYLSKQCNNIRDIDSILEVGDDIYSNLFFGESAVTRDVLFFEKGMDLTQMHTLPNKKYDVFICTNVLNYIYDVRSAIQGAWQLLKPGGVMLATVSGNISQVSKYDYDRWGDYYRFTDMSIRKLVEEYFGIGNVITETYGNVAMATAFIQGCAVEDLPDQTLLDYSDNEYSILIGVSAGKE